MNMIIIKQPKSAVIFEILCISMFCLYVLLTSSSMSRLEIIGSIIGVTGVIIIYLFQSTKAIIVESNRIVVQKVFTVFTIDKKEIMDIKIKSRSAVIIKNNGAKNELRMYSFKQNDIILLKDYFTELKQEISLNEN